MATMQDVAQRAGVSVATVSRVLNNNGYVSTDLRARVQNAIADLDYQPSDLARNLRQKVTQTIGLLIPQLHQPFFSALAYAIEQTLFAQGYHTLICSAEEREDKENAYIDTFLRRQVDGVILVPTGHSIRSVEELLRRGVPIVLVDRDLPQLVANRVLCNNYRGAYEAVQHLLDQGHQRIGLLCAPAYSTAIIERLRGAKQALADAGLPLAPELLITGTRHQFEMGYEALDLLLKAKPTAVFVFTDVIAIGVLHRAIDLGLHVPHHLSVIGFDNIDLASHSFPQLTTVEQPVLEMGVKAAEILLAELRNQGNQSVQQIMLDTRLIIRKSTGQPE